MITGNEPAMPQSICVNENGLYSSNDAPSVPGNGLTIRQHFAAMAMQGLCVDPKTSIEALAKEAVQVADALINELNK